MGTATGASNEVGTATDNKAGAAPRAVKEEVGRQGTATGARTSEVAGARSASNARASNARARNDEARTTTARN